MKFRILIYAFVLAVLSGCGIKQTANKTVEERIVEQLSTRRIVMVADFYHGIALPAQTVIHILDTWVAMVQHGTSNQRRLTLILEDDSTVACAVKTYLDTGDMNPFLNLVLPSMTMERLEFYARLRRIVQHIQALNSKLPRSQQIIFDVEGPEAKSALNPVISDLSKPAGLRYFVDQRDSLAATNVISYLHRHPEQKALIFYGTNHLITKTVVKNVGGSLSAQESVGDYLAFYLKKAFGNDSVFSVNQIPEGRVRQWLKHPLKKDVFYESREVPWRNIPTKFNALNPENFDAFVVRTEVFCPGHPLSQVFSRRILEAAVKRIRSLKSHTEGHLGARYYNQSLTAIRFLTGKDSMNLKSAVSQKVVKSFNGFNRLNSKEFRSQLTDYYMLNASHPRKMAFLVGLGFPIQLERLPALSPAKWNTLLDETMPRVIFLNSIGIAMIGYPEEKAEAMQYLARFSRQNFKSPVQYLKWWRKKYCHAGY